MPSDCSQNDTFERRGKTPNPVLYVVLIFCCIVSSPLAPYAHVVLYCYLHIVVFW